MYQRSAEGSSQQLAHSSPLCLWLQRLQIHLFAAAGRLGSLGVHFPLGEAVSHLPPASPPLTIALRPESAGGEVTWNPLFSTEVLGLGAGGPSGVARNSLISSENTPGPKNSVRLGIPGVLRGPLTFRTLEHSFCCWLKDDLGLRSI